MQPWSVPHAETLTSRHRPQRQDSILFPLVHVHRFPCQRGSLRLDYNRAVLPSVTGQDKTEEVAVLVKKNQQQTPKTFWINCFFFWISYVTHNRHNKDTTDSRHTLRGRGRHTTHIIKPYNATYRYTIRTYASIYVYVYVYVCMCVCAVCLVSYDTRRYDTTTTIQHNLKLMHEMYEQCIDVECACVFFLLSFFWESDKRLFIF